MGYLPVQHIPGWPVARAVTHAAYMITWSHDDAARCMLDF